MNENCSVDEIAQNLSESITQKHKQESLAAATSAAEVLAKLNVSIDAIPQKCQQQLSQVVKAQAETNIEQLDPIAISLQESKLTSEQLNCEYEKFKLEQKNEELQVKIERNLKFLDDLREELDCSKSELMTKTPNVDTLQDAIRRWKQKVASYEESWEKAKNKYSKLPVTDNALPKSIVDLSETLDRLEVEAARLRISADEVELASQARDMLNRLRR